MLEETNWHNLGIVLHQCPWVSSCNISAEQEKLRWDFEDITDLQLVLGSFLLSSSAMEVCVYHKGFGL